VWIYGLANLCHLSFYGSTDLWHLSSLPLCSNQWFFLLVPINGLFDQVWLHGQHVIGLLLNYFLHIKYDWFDCFQFEHALFSILRLDLFD
jgi:hypothetical protein